MKGTNSFLYMARPRAPTWHIINGTGWNRWAGEAMPTSMMPPNPKDEGPSVRLHGYVSRASHLHCANYILVLACNYSNSIANFDRAPIAI